MHVMCLSHYYPPEVGALPNRMSENARNWVKLGHTVTVVTCCPNYPKGKVFPGYKNRFYQTETMDGVTVIRLWTFMAANEGIVFRTLNYASFLVSAVIALPWLPKADVVLSTSPNLFCGVAGGIVSKLLRRPWVLEIRDLWPESIIAVGALKNRALIAPFEALERWAYARATTIVSVTDSFVEHIVANGGDPASIHVIKNGVDIGAFATVSGQSIRDRYQLGNKTVVCYAGTIGLAHKVEHLLTAANRLRHRDDIVFLIAGDGADLERLKRMGAELGLSNVIFTGSLPKRDIPSLLAAVDVFVVMLSKSPLFKRVIPSKMFEAMAASKPIVLAVEGEAASILSDAGAGVVVPPEDPAALASSIAELADAPDRRAALGRNGYACATGSFDRRKLSERYASLLSATARRWTALTGRGVVAADGTADDGGFGSSPGLNGRRPSAADHSD